MLGLWRAFQAFTLFMILGISFSGLGGCASWFTDDSLDPTVHLVKVEVVRAKLLEQKFILHFRIDNPNDSDLTVRGLEYRIHLADMLLAEGEHEHWITVNPKSSAFYNVPIRTNLWPKVKEVVKMLKNPHQQIPYRLEGEMETGLFIAHYVHLARNGVIIPADLITE
ncbi:LEA type 2 family protein [Pseudomonas moraviensis]|uniref:LEA14-like dessication related protein n=1 Tax=Pseudomonas moraviensis TaxID=321662 RepID=A0A7Y9VTA7_9PSED|nr:LEA type 2 family protein [Pseudomonas moraviensis]NYH07696.1 LEA14-like dessication related protein [Pseudomonas moraviensis]